MAVSQEGEWIHAEERGKGISNLGHLAVTQENDKKSGARDERKG